MARRITAKIEEYQKDGQTKGKYIEIGVILENSNGEYMMLNPTVDLAGVLMKQRILAQETGKKVGGSVLCSIFDNDNQSSQPRQHPTQSAPVQETQPDDGFDDIPFK